MSLTHNTTYYSLLYSSLTYAISRNATCYGSRYSFGLDLMRACIECRIDSVHHLHVLMLAKRYFGVEGLYAWAIGFSVYRVYRFCRFYRV